MTTDTSSIPPAAADTSGMNNSAKSAGNETQALEILNAINQNEIDAAAEAKRKNISKAVKDYADMLHQAHTDNYNKTKELANTKGMTLAESDASGEIKRKGMDELNKIKVLEGKEFESAYLTAMINGHAEALSKIDNELLAMATSDDVRQHLTETRGHVAMHLEQAQKLKAGK